MFSGVNDVSVGHLPRVISILIRFTYLLKSHQRSSSLQDNRDIIQDSAVFWEAHPLVGFLLLFSWASLLGGVLVVQCLLGLS